MALTGLQFHLAAGDFEATVVEVGAGLRRLRHRGIDLTVSYGDDVLPPKGLGATLVPWPNRLRGGRYTFDGTAYQLALTEPTAGNAIHGLGRWVRWPVVRQDDAAITLGIDVVPQTGWPFEVRVEVDYVLHAERGLEVTVRGTNRGARRAPFGAGFHPYLATRGYRLDEVAVTVPADQRLITDQAGIPVGAEPVAGTRYDLRGGQPLGDLRLDDGFTGLAVAGGRTTTSVRSPDGGAVLWFDAAFGYAQVFTVDALSGSAAGVAIEPMSCPADAFNSGAGLVILESGESWQGSWGIAALDNTPGDRHGPVR